MTPRNEVHTITDTQGVTVVPRFQDTMKVMRDFQSNRGDGWEIVVGKLDKVTKLSLAISRSLLRTKSISCKTVSDAFEHLKKEDPSLSWGKLNQELVDSIEA